MPKQEAAPAEPLKLNHSAVGGFSLEVGPEAKAVQEHGGVVGLEHLGQKPEPLRVIDPKPQVPAINPGTKIE